MATKPSQIQLLRSQIPNKRPDPVLLLSGQPAVNISVEDPGLYIANINSDLIKIGPTYVGPTAPNTGAVVPGALGNSRGEMWLDTFSTTPSLKVFDGTNWIASASGGIFDYPSTVSFPTVGSADVIYIASDTNVTYRWDSTVPGYVPVGKNPTNIQGYSTLSGFPASGATDVIYIAKDTNTTYRWTGSAYVSIGDGNVKPYATSASFPATGQTSSLYIAQNTNTTYRWDATTSSYVAVGDGASSVAEYATLSSFPTTGVADTIYVAADTGLLYIWDGSGYMSVGGTASAAAVVEYPALANFPATGVSDTIYIDQAKNATYRWDGSAAYNIVGSNNVQNYTAKVSFPAVGVTNTLYVDNTTGFTWRWDTVTLAYKAVSQPTDQAYIIYVSTWGSDTNSGGNIFTPKKTIAAAIAALPAVTEDLYYVISVSPGVYEEVCPMVVPRNVAIVGTNLRSVEIRPTLSTNTQTIFKVDSGFYCTGVTFSRHQANLPSAQAWCVAFNENADNRSISGVTTLGAYITRSPYVWNCTSLTAKQKNPSTTPWAQGGSLSVGATGGGFLVDGAACVKQSPLRSMVVAAFTQVNLQGPGARITNNGYAQLVSFFTTFCTTGVECFNGGQANLETCTTDFGDEGLVADGYSPNNCFTATSNGSYFGGSRIDAAATASAVTDVITISYPTASKLANGDQIILQSTSGTVPTPLIEGQTYYVINANSVANTIQLSATSGGAALNITAAPDPFEVVRQGALQIKVNTPTADSTWFGTSTRPYDGMLMIQVSGGVTYYYDVLSSAQDLPGTGFVVNFFNQTNGGLAAPLSNGDTLSFRLRSQMTATGHTFEYVGSGTNYSAMPYNGGAPDTTKYVIQTNQGRVFWSGTDQRGTFSVGTQFMVDGLTGEVTIDASTFNVSGLNFIGPFSRNGGISTVGVQLQELSNDFNLRSSLGVPDGNTAPTQLAVFNYINSNAAPYQVSATAPTTRADGNALKAGDLYYNSASGLQYTYNGTAWVLSNPIATATTVGTMKTGTASVTALQIALDGTVNVTINSLPTLP